MAVKEYSKEFMDKAISMVMDEGHTAIDVANILHVPVTSIQSELKSRGLSIRRDEQYKVCKCTSTLYRLLENTVINDYRPSEMELNYTEDAEQFVSICDDLRNAYATSSEIDIKHYESLLSQYVAPTAITIGRSIWARMCKYIAEDLPYNIIEQMFEYGDVYYDENDMTMLRDEFYNYMGKYHKRWATKSAGAHALSYAEQRIIAMWEETVERSDGKKVHLWTQREIANACNVAQPTVSVIIKKYCKEGD